MSSCNVRMNISTPNGAKTMTSEDLELGDDLRITKTTRRAAGAGTWVCGTIAGHRFDALV